MKLNRHSLFVCILLIVAASFSLRASQEESETFPNDSFGDLKSEIAKLRDEIAAVNKRIKFLHCYEGKGADTPAIVIPKDVRLVWAPFTTTDSKPPILSSEDCEKAPVQILYHSEIETWNFVCYDSTIRLTSKSNVEFSNPLLDGGNRKVATQKPYTKLD